MKTKLIDKSYADVMALPTPKHEKPKRMNSFFKVLIKMLSAVNLHRYHVDYRETGMERLEKKEPCLVLMNHSGFIDMQIAANYLYPRGFSTVTTTDAYIGLAPLLRTIGCIPTQKFVSDLTLIKDMVYALRENKTTVLMYPEAVYSFDGTAMTLPDSIGKLLKLLKVPVVTIITHGAYLREPLYNMLQHRKIDLTVDVDYLVSPEEIEQLSADELNAKIAQAFSFDDFRWQRENQIKIDAPFRADGLQRVLYQCPHCLAEGQTVGQGTRVTCRACGKVWELTEEGALRAEEGETYFDHVPDWYDWEREQVRGELERGEYRLDIDVDLYMMIDYKALYHVGDGHLLHDANGFHLTGCDGELDYIHQPMASYTINADYYFYEIGDTISFGNKRHLFYCFPKDQSIPVAKAKIAAEEIYKTERSRHRVHK